MAWRSFWVDMAVFAMIVTAMLAHPWDYLFDLLGVP